MAAYTFRYFLPTSPLLAYLRGQFGDNQSAWARAVSRDRASFRQLVLHAPHLRLSNAERISDKLGCHPSEIWGEEYFEVVLRKRP